MDDIFLIDLADTPDIGLLFEDGMPISEAPPTGAGMPWGWRRPYYDRRAKARKDEDILLF